MLSKWTKRNPLVDVGLLPMIFQPDDDRTPQEQANDRYAHGGGWQSFEGFELTKSADYYTLQYPDDPPMHELARAPLGPWTLVFFQGSWLAVIGANGSFDVARMD